MRAVDGGQSAWHAIRCELCAERGCQMLHNVDVPAVAQRIRLNVSDWFLQESRGQKAFANDQLVGPFGALDSRPDVIPLTEADRGFKEVAVEDRVVFQRA